jgi:hypothetical protein
MLNKNGILSRTNNGLGVPPVQVMQDKGLSSQAPGFRNILIPYTLTADGYVYRKQGF